MAKKKADQVDPEIVDFESTVEEPEIIEPIIEEQEEIEPVNQPVAPHVRVGGEPKKLKHIVSAGDLNLHPELSEQGVSFKDEIDYGSKWVYKYTSSDKNGVIQDAWPRDISGTKI